MFEKQYDQKRAQVTLVTYHGTVLYIDAGTGLLRHGPVHANPSNVIFVSDGPNGRITYYPMHFLLLVACQIDHCRVVGSLGDNVDPSAEPTTFLRSRSGI